MSGPWEKYQAASDGPWKKYQTTTDQPQQQEQPKSPDLASTLYHGAIEGGAMAVGGAAGTVLAGGNPIGGVALGAAMYPPAKRVAEAIDQYRGITPPESQNIASEYGQGLAIEAGNAALKPVMGMASKFIPGAKTGEAISGTPASNLSRAYKQGFWDTYIKPKTLANAGDAFGDAKFKMVGNTITPEEQAAMMVNPRGEANNKVYDVMVRWLKGEKISASDALAARQGADTIFPADVAKSQARRGGFSQFKQAMNDIIAQENPEFSQASKDYAASKLRSDLLKPLRVNKSNPNQYSKLGVMLDMVGGKLPFVNSPLAMGLISSASGSTARALSPAVDSLRTAALAAFVDRITTKDNQ